MPKIEGYHPVCHCCNNDNDTPKYKWCSHCRRIERIKYQQRGKTNPTQTNACGLGYTEMVDAGDIKDTLQPEGLQVEPGHKPGWWRII